MAHHELRIWPAYYKAVKAGEKTFEYRENDRGFVSGDSVELHEWDPTTGQYTRSEPLKFTIGYCLPIPQSRFVVFSLLSDKVRFMESALQHIVKKVPEKVSRAEAADMAVEFKTVARRGLEGRS